MTARTRNIVVGLVVLVALLGVGWMILQFSSRSITTLFSKRVPFRIIADRADGLGEGSGVQYLGVTVGQVTGIKRLPNNTEVQIDAVLNEGEALPRNVTGFIRAQSALGTAAGVALETKDRQPPSAETLQANDVIRAVNRNQGLIPPELAELGKSIQEQKLIAHIDETFVELKLQLRRAGELMEGFNKFVGDPKVRDDLTTAIASAKTTIEGLEKFSKRLDGIAVETDATMKQARTTLADGGKRVDEVSKQLGDRLSQIGELLEKFNAITAKVDKGQGTLGMLVNDPRLYEGLVDTTKTLNLTVADLHRLVEQWEQEGFTLKLK
jgi:phospholipid/cholesterol/gamma-HCH transport system substrate-binding protein